MSQDLKKVIREEYLKCAKSPVYFMRKYGFISHPQRGKIIFNLYPFQENVLSLLQKHDYTIINKARQLGISTLVAGYALWLMTFHPDKNILCIATKEATAKNLVKKVKFMYEALPSWLKLESSTNSELVLKLINGSEIKATSSNTEAGRSEAVSLLIIDEAAFIDNIKQIWASAQQTLATGGSAIALSSPNGTGNWFHQIWEKAEINDEDNEFLPIKLPWYLHPERDEVWRKKQDVLLGDPRWAAQECDCDFTTSGDTVFYSEWIKWIKDNTIKDPLERRGFDKNLWVWEPVDYSREYVIIADVSRGDGKDFSTCHVLDIEKNEQVAEYRGKLSPKEFGYFLVSLGTEYNNALVVVENANVGWAVLDAMFERQYRNIYHSPRSEQFTADSYFKATGGNSDMVPGFTMSMRTRPLVINKLREYVSEKSITIRSIRTLNEFEVFIWKSGRPEARTGYNDDLIIPLATGVYLRDTSLRFQQNNLEMTKATLGGIKTNKASYAGGYNGNSAGQNPYEMEVRGQKENINWLL